MGYLYRTYHLSISCTLASHRYMYSLEDLSVIVTHNYLTLQRSPAYMQPEKIQIPLYVWLHFQIISDGLIAWHK